MNIVYGIYDHTGSLVYIGQTKNLDQRKAGHLSSSKSKLRKWMEEHGVDQVDFRVLGMYQDAAIAKGVEAGIINATRPPLNTYCTGEYFRSKYISVPRRTHSKTSNAA